MDREVRLKKIITNAKLNNCQKKRLFVITDSDGKIIWIPLVKRANHGMVSATTEQILTIGVNYLS
jgi:hypothetical protein